MASEYRYGGAGALVELHERHLRSFFETWKQAHVAGVKLPETDDPAYASMAALLRHLLSAAGKYMIWICEKLELPDPGIHPVPEVGEVADRAVDYLDHVLERWRLPLRDVSEERFYEPVYESRWGVDYCIDAMLEHAVMHPVRHEFQLVKLMRGDA